MPPLRLVFPRKRTRSEVEAEAAAAAAAAAEAEAAAAAEAAAEAQNDDSPMIGETDSSWPTTWSRALHRAAASARVRAHRRPPPPGTAGIGAHLKASFAGVWNLQHTHRCTEP